MFGKIVFVDFDEIALNGSHGCRVFAVDPGGDAFRHAANDEIVVVGFQQTIVKKFQNGLFFFNAAVVSVERWIGGVEKFIEREGIEVQQVDHAHWIGFWLGEQRAEQAAGGDDVVVVGFFFEIFEFCMVF